MLRRFLPLLALVLACKSTLPPVKQNPSPMVEQTRAHERIAEHPLKGKRFTLPSVVAGVGKPVDVLVTPAAITAGRGDLIVHFHGAAWLPMQAVEESNRALVIAVVNLGAGSGLYSRSFRDPAVFARLVDDIRHSSPEIDRIYLTGFSAGYGAIREIVRAAPESIAGVLLLDGLHASYIPEGKPMAEGGRINEENLAPFLAFARRAMAGEKRFVITHSEIFPGTFASTTETTDWLLRALELKRKPLVGWGPRGMQQLSESRSGSLTVLGFAGNSAPDHIDHLHGYGEFVRVLLGP